MAVFGWLLIFLAAPLVIGYLLNDRKKKTWGRLAVIMIIVGVLLAMAG